MFKNCLVGLILLLPNLVIGQNYICDQKMNDLAMWQEVDVNISIHLTKVVVNEADGITRLIEYDQILSMPDFNYYSFKKSVRCAFPINGDGIVTILSNYYKCRLKTDD